MERVCGIQPHGRPSNNIESLGKDDRGDSRVGTRVTYVMMGIKKGMETAFDSKIQILGFRHLEVRLR